VKTANFRDQVLYPACDDLGIDVDRDLTKQQADTLARSINHWTKEDWEAWPWPELNLTEERPFRQKWVNAYAGYKTGDELYFETNGLYYRVKADPPAGTNPTNVTYYEPLPEPWERYLAYDQVGEQSIGLVRGITNVDPRTSASGVYYPFGPGEKGIDVYGWSGTSATIWLRYQVRPSKFSCELVVADAVYPAGKVIYDKAIGECYLALEANAPGNNLTDAKWKLQPMPECLANYVKYNAAADQADDKARSDELRGLAMASFSRETDKLIEQGFPAPSYNFGRRRSRSLPNKNFVLVAAS
jgi:hypothetical protein